MGNSSQLCPRLQLLIDSLPCFTTLFQGYLPLQQICHRADEQNALKIVSPPPIKVQTKPVHLRKPVNPWPIRKTHLTQS
jgi:hypothetical protein